MKFTFIRVFLSLVSVTLLVTQYVNCGAKGKFDGEDDSASDQSLQPGAVGLDVISSTTNSGAENMVVTGKTVAQATIAVSGRCNPGDYLNTNICIAWDHCAALTGDGSGNSTYYTSVPMRVYDNVHTSATDSTKAPQLFRQSTGAACVGSYITIPCTNGIFTAFIPPPPQEYWRPPTVANATIGTCTLNFKLNDNTAALDVYIH